MINLAIALLGGAIFLAVLSFSAWTVINTRKKYYEEFLRRKSEREKLHLP